MNNSTPSTPPVPPLSAEDISYVIIGIITVITNGFGIYVLINGRMRLKGQTYTILVSSFAACFMFAFWYNFCVRVLQLRAPDKEVRNFICNFGGNGSWALMTNINLHLCLISIDRYLFVMYPFNYRKIVNKLYVSIVLFIIWLLPVIILMVIFTYRHLDMTVCTFDVSTRAELLNDAISVTVLLSFLFFIPLLIIIGIYIHIFFMIKSHTEAKYRNRDATVCGKAVRRNVKAVRQMIILIGIFTICWMPFAIYSIALVWISQFQFHLILAALHHIVRSLSALRYIAYAYPLFHPILYCYFNSQIKLEVMRVTCTCIGRKEKFREHLSTINGTKTFRLEQKSFAANGDNNSIRVRNDSTMENRM